MNSQELFLKKKLTKYYSKIFEEEIISIVEKLQFKRVTSIEDKEIFYSEKSIGGYDVIMPVYNEEETPIDIELLFKAVLNKAEIKL